MDRLIACLAILAATPAVSQTADVEHEAVLKTVDAALAAVSSQDSPALARLLVPGALFYREGHREAGKPVTRVIPGSAMLDQMKGPKMGYSELRTGTPTVLVRKGVAHVWTSYSFDVAGKRSHCGIDSISLLKVDGVWQITSFGWTAEPEGCTE
jgi:hypothetical protein